MDKLVNITFDVMTDNDLEEVLDLIAENMKTIKELRLDLSYKRDVAREHAKNMIQNTDYITLVSRMGDKIVGLGISMLHYSLWDSSVLECTETALNSDTALAKGTQLKIQMGLLKLSETIAKKRGAAFYRMNILRGYNMETHMKNNNYREISRSYMKELI